MGSQPQFSPPLTVLKEPLPTPSTGFRGTPTDGPSVVHVDGSGVWHRPRSCPLPTAAEPPRNWRSQTRETVVVAHGLSGFQEIAFSGRRVDHPEHRSPNSTVAVLSGIPLGRSAAPKSNRGFLCDEVLHTKLQMSVEDLLKGFAVVAYFPEFEVAIPGGSQFQPNRLAVRRQYSGVRNSL